MAETEMQDILKEILEIVEDILDSEEVKEKVPKKYLVIAKTGLKILEAVLAGEDKEASEILKELIDMVEDLLKDPEISQAIPKKYMFIIKLALKILKMVL